MVKGSGRGKGRGRVNGEGKGRVKGDGKETVKEKDHNFSSGRGSVSASSLVTENPLESLNFRCKGVC